MLEQIQYRMAEIIFRPIRVLRACWAEARKTRNHSMLAADDFDNASQDEHRCVAKQQEGS
jgi:hypothetical protein